MSGAKTKPRELRGQRRAGRHGCWDQLIVAPLWVAYDANLGTLLRTCDAVGACLAVPRTPHYRQALQIGDTLRGRRPCLHWVTPGKQAWIAGQRAAGKRIVAVELAAGATSLARLGPHASPRCCFSVTNTTGFRTRCSPTWTNASRFPMVGWGASLNVAVAGSLVAYRLAGLS